MGIPKERRERTTPFYIEQSFRGRMLPPTLVDIPVGKLVMHFYLAGNKPFAEGHNAYLYIATPDGLQELERVENAPENDWCQTFAPKVISLLRSHR